MSSLAVAQDLKIKPLVLPNSEDREHRHITLPNGLQAVLVHDSEADKAAAAVACKVGCLQDPEHAQGLAHFCEHMLFLGTEKFPDETAYSAFLNAHGGSSNAYTDLEDTVYFYDVNADHMAGALDIFAQFFIGPLFTESATEREMMAVDSEHSKNLQNDYWRQARLLQDLASADHPFQKFGTGNLKTLRDDPAAIGVKTREELLKFHQRYYSANLMALAVVGRESVDELQEMVVRIFSPVVDKGVARPVFEGPPPYGDAQLGKRLSVVPVKDLRQVQLMWPLPPMEPHYREKPHRYLSHLLGHEGKGSLLSLLKARGLANDLWAGESVSVAEFTSFVVSVDCTDAGMERRDEVVSAVYSYIRMLRQEGPSERIFREVQEVCAMNFRFSNKTKPMQYARRLATSMHLYPPELTVAGGSLLYDYDPDLIRKVTDLLTPERMILAISSKAFEGEGVADRTEQWYGTKYGVEDIPLALLKQWDEAPLLPELTLPEPNPFIATDFILRSDEEDGKGGGDVAAAAGTPPGPVLLKEEEGFRLWFKQDRVFRKPKLCVRYKLATPAVYESPLACAMTDLLVGCLKELFNEINYAASQASLYADVYSTKTALCFDFRGYNHKLPVLIDKVLGIVARCKELLTQELYDRIRDKMEKEYRNQRFRQQYEHAMEATSICLDVPKWVADEKLAALLATPVASGPAALGEFAARVLGRVSTEVLVHGNADAAQAAEIAAQLDAALPHAPLPPAEYPELRAVELAAAAYLRRQVSPNPEEVNSGVEVVYVAGVETARLLARLRLIAHLMRDQAFDTLRTKESLGYLVWTGVSTQAEYVHGIHAIIVSSGHGPSYLDSRIEAFLKTFREYMSALTEAEVEENKTALRETLLEKDKNLSEENQRYWREISLRRYQFDRAQVLAAEVAMLTLADVLQTFDEHVAAGSSTRKKLSSQVVGSDHVAEDDVLLAAALAAAADPAHPGGAIETVVIEDPDAFRKTRPLYPPRAVSVIPSTKL